MASIYEQLASDLQKFDRVIDLAAAIIEGKEGVEVRMPDGELINTFRESLAQYREAAANVGDIAQDLASDETGKGASLVRYSNGSTVQQYLPQSSIYALAQASFLRFPGLVITVASMMNDHVAGFGQWRWNAARPKSDADFGRVFDPDALGGWDGTAGAMGATVLAAQGTGGGVGCWERIGYDRLIAAMWGAVGDYDGVSGTDNTPMLQAAKLAAPDADIHLGFGRYLITDTILEEDGFSVGGLIGAGSQATELIYEFSDDRAAFKLRGGSGNAPMRVAVSDLRLSGSETSTAIEISGQCAVFCDRVVFGPNAIGVVFHDQQGGEYTEYAQMRDCHFTNECALDADYRITDGTGSFHGSGFRGCLTHKLTSGPRIRIHKGAYVYNAPMDFHCWAETDQGPVFEIVEEASYSLPRPTKILTHGDMKIESLSGFTTSSVTTFAIGPADTQFVHSGDLRIWGYGSSWRLGILTLAAQVRTDGGNIRFLPQPRRIKKAIVSSATTFSLPRLWRGAANMAHIYITGSGYDYAAIVHILVDKSGSGALFKLSEQRWRHNGEYGPDTIEYVSGELRIIDAEFPVNGSYTISVTWTHFGDGNYAWSD